jgi:hypothetical protein
MKRIKLFEAFAKFKDVESYTIWVKDHYLGEEKKMRTFGDYEKCLIYLFYVWSQADEKNKFLKRKEDLDSELDRLMNPSRDINNYLDKDKEFDMADFLSNARYSVIPEGFPGDDSFEDWMYLQYIEEPYDEDSEKKIFTVLGRSQSWREFIEKYDMEVYGQEDWRETHIFILWDPGKEREIGKGSSSFGTGEKEIKQKQILLDMDKMGDGLNQLCDFNLFKKNILSNRGMI